MEKVTIRLHNQYCPNVVHINNCKNECVAISSNRNNDKFIGKYKLKGIETNEEIKIIKEFITWTSLQRKETSRRNRIKMQMRVIEDNISELESIKKKNHKLNLVIKANKNHLKRFKNQLDNGVITYIWKTLSEIEAKIRLY